MATRILCDLIYAAQVRREARFITADNIVHDNIIRGLAYFEDSKCLYIVQVPTTFSLFCLLNQAHLLCLLLFRA